MQNTSLLEPRTDDYHLWVSYWYSFLYGAGPQVRMKNIDRLRAKDNEETTKET